MIDPVLLSPQLFLSVWTFVPLCPVRSFFLFKLSVSVILSFFSSCFSPEDFSLHFHISPASVFLHPHLLPSCLFTSHFSAFCFKMK